MPDEGSFLQAILANPADDLPRLVYADWLEEQQTDEAKSRAEFLRGTAALLNESRERHRRKLERRLKELARDLPTDWLPVVSRLSMENCPQSVNPIRRPLQTVQFEFECPLKWESLTPTPEVAVRHCESCKQSVYYCETIGDARAHARQGHCVAVDIAIPRKRDDLNPPRRLMGRMLPNSRAWERMAERERLANEPDEVSSEREERRRNS